MTPSEQIVLRAMVSVLGREKVANLLTTPLSDIVRYKIAAEYGTPVVEDLTLDKVFYHVTAKHAQQRQMWALVEEGIRSLEHLEKEANAPTAQTVRGLYGAIGDHLGELGQSAAKGVAFGAPVLLGANWLANRKMEEADRKAKKAIGLGAVGLAGALGAGGTLSAVGKNVVNRSMAPPTQGGGFY